MSPTTVPNTKSTGFKTVRSTNKKRKKNRRTLSVQPSKTERGKKDESTEETMFVTALGGTQENESSPEKIEA
jgi:hypothetical protein